jgi:putative SOS response-associated peptidase YedK
MPLVLNPVDWTRWLDPAVDGPAELLQPQDEAVREALELRPVSQAVNSVKNNSPELISEIEPPIRPLELF